MRSSGEPANAGENHGTNGPNIAWPMAAASFTDGSKATQRVPLAWPLIQRMARRAAMAVAGGSML